MKRDMNLVLEILRKLEDRDEVSVIEQMEVPGYDNLLVAYHLHRMYEAGLLDAETINSSSTESRIIKVLPFGLTWEGHEFLDSMRQETVANAVRRRLGNTLSGVPFTLIRELALAIGRGQLGL